MFYSLVPSTSIKGEGVLGFNLSSVSYLVYFFVCDGSFYSNEGDSHNYVVV